MLNFRFPKNEFWRFWNPFDSKHFDHIGQKKEIFHLVITITKKIGTNVVTNVTTWPTTLIRVTITITIGSIVVKIIIVVAKVTSIIEVTIASMIIITMIIPFIRKEGEWHGFREGYSHKRGIMGFHPS